MTKHIFYHGDVIDCLRRIPEKSVNTVVTSPPYWGLRDYGVEGQIGLEKTPEEYVAKMVEVFREVKRVLRDDGTLWLNLGDCYSRKIARLKPKDLVGIPWMVAFALRADGWYLRSDIIWAKPNPMPESVTDRPTGAHEYIFLLAKAKRYFYDADAIREPHVRPLHAPGNKTHNGRLTASMGHFEEPNRIWGNPSGRNKRSVWTVSTKPFPEAHFATFPPELIRPCILAGSPVGGTVLDPFGGSGTVSMVAMQEGRDSIYIDLNRKYLDMALRRCGFGGDKPTFDQYEVKEI